MDRQSILSRSIPPMLWVVLDESILQRPIAGPEVMKAQYAHLLQISLNRRISLQVLPYAACSVVGLLGGFVVADMPGEAPPAAYIDSQSTGDRVSCRLEEVKHLAFLHDVIRADALSRRDSRAMIEEAVQRWST